MLLVDEGIIQAIFGFVSSLYIDDYEEITLYMLESFIKKTDKVTVLLMDEIDIMEFQKRSTTRLDLHPFIRVKLAGNSEVIAKFEMVYNFVQSNCKFDIINSAEFECKKDSERGDSFS